MTPNLRPNGNLSSPPNRQRTWHQRLNVQAESRVALHVMASVKASSVKASNVMVNSAMVSSAMANSATVNSVTTMAMAGIAVDAVVARTGADSMAPRAMIASRSMVRSRRGR